MIVFPRAPSTWEDRALEGALLAYALGDELGVVDADERHAVLDALRSLPDAMRAVVTQRPAIALAVYGPGSVSTLKSSPMVM